MVNGLAHKNKNSSLMRKDIPILIDFDGVVRLGRELAADAAEFLNFLHSEKLPFFIITLPVSSCILISEPSLIKV